MLLIVTISVEMTVRVLAMVLNLVMLMTILMVTTVLYGLSTYVCYETRVFFTNTTNYFTDLYLTHRLNVHINIILLHCRS